MMNRTVIDCYNYINEDTRLSYNQARKVEYLTNLFYIQKIVKRGMRVLDCSCGTGAYIFDLWEIGAEIFAYDLTPKHIAILNDKIRDRNIENIITGVIDATDLSIFPDNYFDIVLCMGALYHLLSKQEQIICVAECKRVAKQGGVLFFSYLNRSPIFPYVLKKMDLLSEDIIDSFFKNKKTEYGKDEYCFFTDSFYHIPEEIESIMLQEKLLILNHIGSDGLTFCYEEYVNQLPNEKFSTWMKYHLQICEQKSLIGASHHGLIITQKK